MLGQVQLELWRLTKYRYPFLRPIPEATFDVLHDAARNMGVGVEWLSTPDVDADVFSEAIEAAEALGL